MTGHRIPKSARAPHKRKARTTGHINIPDRYRVEGTWPDRPTRPATYTTNDRKKARAIARKWADSGAYVTVQENQGWRVWRDGEEIDGPALLARRAAEQAAADEARRHATEAEQRLARLDAEHAAQTAQNERARALDAEAEHDRLARLMVRPPVPRDATGRPTARHTAGGRR